MPTKPKVPDKADDKEQSERFIETAMERDTDESGKAFERLFKTVAPVKNAARKTSRPR